MPGCVQYEDSQAGVIAANAEDATWGARITTTVSSPRAIDACEFGLISAEIALMTWFYIMFDRVGANALGFDGARRRTVRVKVWDHSFAGCPRCCFPDRIY